MVRLPDQRCDKPDARLRFHSEPGLDLPLRHTNGCIQMAKKVAITVVLFYLLGVIGVTTGALAMNWNADWSLQQQLGEAAWIGFGWPLSVVELFTPD